MFIFFNNLQDIFDLSSDACILLNNKKEIILYNDNFKKLFEYNKLDKLNIKSIILEDLIYTNNSRDYLNIECLTYSKKKIYLDINIKILKYYFKNYFILFFKNNYDTNMLEYKVFFDNNIDMLCIARDGYFIKINESFINKLGYTSEHLYKYPYVTFVHPDDINSTNIETSNLDNGHICVNFTNRYLTKNNIYIWLSWKSVCIENIIYATARDITEQKEFENKLIEAKLDAEKASALKSMFVANVSHELRTPINGILGMATLMDLSDLNDEQREYNNIIVQSSEILLSLINNVLDLSKIETGKMEIENINININEFINIIKNHFNYIIKNKNLEFNIIIDKNIPPNIKSDQIKIQQILFNLINNSIKFTEKGSIILTISIINNYINFSVKDTGIGITSENQNKLFEPFTQADNSTTREYGGSGLGLSICRHLVDLLGGIIELHSTYGLGTIISFSLPIVILRKNSSTADVQDKKLIIIVEDNIINQKVISKMLLKLNCNNFIIYENGDRAYNKIMKLTKHPSLIFMDLHMPIMDGYECTKKLRQGNIKTPIIALTANGMIGEEDRCIEIGMNDFILKPLQLNILKQVLETWCDIKE